MKPQLLILVVEGDEAARARLAAAFRAEGHTVHSAGTIKAAVEFLSYDKPDLIILDRELPDGDGMQLVLRIRKGTALSGMPLLMLSGKAGTEDKILGLRLGADDYLAKPFEMEELLSRADALIRRSRGGAFTSSRIACQGIVIDVPGRRVLMDGDEVKLTDKEFDLLRALAERAGTPCTREFLMETVWKEAGEPGARKVVDVTIMNLRRKLGAFGARIAAVRSTGYMLRKPT